MNQSQAMINSTISSTFSLPRTLEETGLRQTLLEDLLARTMLEAGVVTLRDLGERLKLASVLLETLLAQFKADGRLEVRAAGSGSTALRFALTNGGVEFARSALDRSGYVGPAPVPQKQYEKAVLAQSLRAHRINKTLLAEDFRDIVLKPSVRDQLGAAMYSGKAIFIYGPPGSGKTYICSKLARLLGEPVRIPYAVSSGDSIIRVFDPLLHEPIQAERDTAEATLLVSGRHDDRYILCERPFITSGGELTADMLEVQYDAASRQYQAPLQMKALNGMYLIDDLGRQRISTAELFNRWIVPMESAIDYLSTQSGDRLAIPFDLLLVFSTNLNPADIADAAFLRRIGHKIHLDYLDRDEYQKIWDSVCQANEVRYTPELLSYVIEELHQKRQQPMAACHPRDLVSLACNFLDYESKDRSLTSEVMNKAWESNFIAYN